MNTKSYKIDIPFKIYLDIDGVLSDFAKGVSGLLGREFTIGHRDVCKEEETIMWEAIIHAQKHGHRFWANLPLLPDAMMLWEYVKGYRPAFLTATEKYGELMNVAPQKREWVTNHFGEGHEINIVVKAREKATFSGLNQIIIDDREKVVGPWREAGGIGILHKDAKSSIEELCRIGL